MNVMGLMDIFPTEQSCTCHILKKSDGVIIQHARIVAANTLCKKVRDKTERWNCHDKYCKSTFTVKSGTLFNGTKIELRTWFLAISLMMKAKKSVSSHQLGRDLGITQQTALAIQHKIRKEMGRKTSKLLLKGIIEADETFMGGKPRRRKDKDGNLPPPSKRGRGTKKAKVLGAVQRGGEVVARVVTNLSG